MRFPRTAALPPLPLPLPNPAPSLSLPPAHPYPPTPPSGWGVPKRGVGPTAQPRLRGWGANPHVRKQKQTNPVLPFQPAQEFLGHLPFQPNPQKLRKSTPKPKKFLSNKPMSSPAPQPSPQPSLASPARQPAQQPNHPASQLASPATPPAQPASPARPARAHAKSKAKKTKTFAQNSVKTFAQNVSLNTPDPNPIQFL